MYLFLFFLNFKDPFDIIILTLTKLRILRRNMIYISINKNKQKNLS